MLTIICALAEDRAIGYRNRLLFHLRADLQRFKSLTTGRTIIMGRRTFESLPQGALPHRRNLVITRSTETPWENTEIFPSLEAALNTCSPQEEVFVIGGAALYAQALPIADRLCLTHIHAQAEEADVFFPPFDADGWKCVFREEHPADEHNQHPFTFADYLRS